MKRTIRRTSLPLNKGKWDALCEMARRYADEKNAHLRDFGNDRYFSECGSDRTRRDALVREKYASPFGLQARMWKMSLKDAYETVERNHAAFAVVLRRHIAGKKNWNDSQKASLIGKNLIDMKDSNGKEFIKEFIKVAKEKGSGWVDYMWSKPGETVPSPKTSYVLKIDDELFVGAGIYK